MLGKCSELVWLRPQPPHPGPATPVPNIFRTFSEHVPTFPNISEDLREGGGKGGGEGGGYQPPRGQGTGAPTQGTGAHQGTPANCYRRVISVPTGYRRGPSVDTVCGKVVFPRSQYVAPHPLSPSPPPHPRRRTGLSKHSTQRPVLRLRPVSPSKQVGPLAAVSGCPPCPTSKRMSSNQHLAAQGHKGSTTTFPETATGGRAGNCCETMARVAGADPLGPSSMSSRMCKKTPGSR